MRDCLLKTKLINSYEFAYKYIFPLPRWIKLRLFYRLRIMSSSQTLRYIKKHQCSIARFGDGEMSYILNLKHDIAFQKYSHELSQKLQLTLQKKNPTLLICLPRYLVSLRGCTPHCQRYWWFWGKNDYRQEEITRMVRKCTGRNRLFGDALISRPYMDRQNARYASKIFRLTTDLWAGRDLLIVEGDQTRLGVGNDLFSQCHSIKRVLAPSIGAFDAYDKIMETILTLHTGELVILALGPTATVLAADLADAGIQALDIGHLDIEYEWFLNHATTKEAIVGKFTNESVAGRSFTECNDDEYLSQIIARIQ